MSVLDPHWGTIEEWRRTIDAIHARGMYLMLDFTVGTMGDLIGFEGYVSRRSWLVSPSRPFPHQFPQYEYALRPQ